ncbi:tyrosine-type recombinase/integrase [Acidobacteriota bacterium]
MAKKGQTCFNYGYGSVYFRKTKSGIIRWYVYFYDAKGKRQRRVAKNAKNREEALAELKQTVLNEHYGRDAEARNKNLSFKEFAQCYLNDYSKVKKRAWEKSDKVYLNANLIPFFGEYNLVQIDMLLIEKYIAKRLNDKVQKSSINRDLSCLRKMLNKAVDWNYLVMNPAAKVKLFPEKDNIRSRVLTEEEEAKLLEESANHLKPILITALNTGMRRGEILKLTWNQINFETKQIRVENTKSGRARIIPINWGLYEVFVNLRSNAGNSSFVFFNTKTGKPFTTIKTAFNAACRRANVKGLWLHDLRRTFACRLLYNGADIETVKSLLGHHSLVVTQRYTHSNDERKKIAVGLLCQKSSKSAGNMAQQTHHRHMSSVRALAELPAHLFSVN